MGALVVATLLLGGMAATWRPVYAADQGRSSGTDRAGQDAPPGPVGDPTPGLGPRPLTPPREDEDPIEGAVERALDFLAEQQTVMRDGSLPASQGQFHAPVGVTSLAALAWMAGGSTPGRGPHSGPLVRAIEYLLAHQAPEDDKWAGWIAAPEDQQSRSHGHGLAILALSQAYTMSPESPLGRRIARALELGVERIMASQGLEGGWYYDAYRSADHEGSVTVCLVQALRGARNAGIHVDAGAIQKAIAYVRKLQTAEGGFKYSFSQDAVSVALTGACLSTLHSAGIYEDKDVERAYDWIWRELFLRSEDEGRGINSSQPSFPYYERFYLSQALWHNPDPEVYRRWSTPLVRRLLVSQNADGSWTDVRHDGRGSRQEDRYGACYATAMNVLFLSVPEGTLPIFRR